MRWLVRVGFVLGFVTALLTIPACPNDDCYAVRKCPTSSHGAGGSGGTGGTGEGGSVGGSSTCGNGRVDPGELCFTNPAVDFPTQGEQAVDLVLVDCNGDGAL